jgi:hypothetical protein
MESSTSLVGDMKKILALLASMFLLVGCAESMALLGPIMGAASGKTLQSSIQSGVSYGIKKQTGKSPFEHALAASKKTDEKICDTFNQDKSKSCNTITNKIITTDNIIEEKKRSARELAIALQLKIKKNSKIRYLD